jgi:hypothetical protein
VIDDLLATRDQVGPVAGGHPLRYYTWTALEALLARHPGEVVAAAASNFLAIGNEALLEPLLGDPARWEAYLSWEVECCRQAGALDGGTHLIAVVRKTAAHRPGRGGLRGGLRGGPGDDPRAGRRVRPVGQSDPL